MTFARIAAATGSIDRSLSGWALPAGTRFICTALAMWLLITPTHATPGLVFDMETSNVLYAEEPDQAWHPASLTKLMTAYLIFQDLRAGRLKMTDQIIQSENSAQHPPSKIGLPVGAGMSVETGLRALIIKSANDVAVMLAEKASGTEEKFVARMNATAQRLGMRRTRFFNPNGLPDSRQVTTARDMAVLARAIILQFPEHAELFTLDRMRFGKAVLRSHNALLRVYDGADGMKTGFICASGFNVVASASRNGRRLVAVVLGGATPAERTERARQLFDYGFRTVAWRTLFPTATLDSLTSDPDGDTDPVNFRRFARVSVCGYRVKRQAQRTSTTSTTRSETPARQRPRVQRTGAFRASNR